MTDNQQRNYDAGRVHYMTGGAVGRGYPYFEVGTPKAKSLAAFRKGFRDGKSLQRQEIEYSRAARDRKNPSKAQKREKARKASVQRRVATALANFLKKANPAMKTTGARITKLKGGGFNIRPIKAKRGKR